jgi:hypothetical protein
MRSAAILLTLFLAVSANALDLSPLEQQIVDLTNAERKAAGLGELKPSEKLFIAARAHSANQAKQKTMSHVLDGKSVESRVKEAGYDYFKVGENVALNQPDAESVLKSWMDSPGHRENILTPAFTEIGVGVVKDDSGEPYYTQVFGRPVSAGPTARATISIQNNTDDPISVSLPSANGSAKIQPGGSGSFTLAGAGDLPPAKVTVGTTQRDVPMKEGAKYVVSSSRRGVEISDASESEKPKRERPKTIETSTEKEAR